MAVSKSWTPYIIYNTTYCCCANHGIILLYVQEDVASACSVTRWCHTTCYPHIWTHCIEKILASWHFEGSPTATPTNYNAWLRAILLEKLVLSHYMRRRYGMITINFLEMFSNDLKGARNVLITACVQMTFYWFERLFVLQLKAVVARL